MSALTSANPDNANPTVYAAGGEKRRKLGDFLDDSDSEGEDGALTWSGESSGSDDAMQDITMPVREEPIDSYEIYDLIRSITDPEHPLTLEQLAVVNAEHITVTHGPRPAVKVVFTVRTVPNAAAIGSRADGLANITSNSTNTSLSYGYDHRHWQPTIPHCSMATLIGLSIRVRLLRSLPDRFKVDIRVKEGSHESENSLNKQLNDKERVAAALENNHLLGVVEQCLSTSGQRGQAPKEA